MSSSDVLVTVVQTAEELQGAVQHSAKHIEIRQHIDLTGSEPLNEEQHIVKKILGWPGAGVESIRGNCTGDPPQAFLNSLGGVVALRPRASQQCVILTDMDLLRIQYGPMWLDNLYVRLRRSARDDQPQLIESEFDGQAYLTRMTIQGDGDTTMPCQAAKVSAGMLIHDSELAHLNGPGLSAVLADGNQAWIQNTTFVSIDSPSPGAVIKADFDGSAVALTDVNFEAIAEGTELLRSRNGRIFSDVERDVLNDVSDSAEATEALSAIPDDFSLLRPTDPWLTDRQVLLSNLNRDNYQPYSPPNEKGTGGTVILISVAGVILILFIGLALLWRGRRKRHSSGMDEWGLPIRVLKTKPSMGRDMGSDADTRHSHHDHFNTMSGSEAVTATTPLHHASHMQTCHLVQSGNTMQNGSSVVGDESGTYREAHLRTSGGAGSNYSRTRESSYHRSAEIDAAPPTDRSLDRNGSNHSRTGHATAGSTPCFNPSVAPSLPATSEMASTAGGAPKIHAMVQWSNGTIDGAPPGGHPAQAAYNMSPQQQQQLMQQQHQQHQQQQQQQQQLPRAGSAHGSLQGSSQRAHAANQSAQLQSYGSNSSMAHPAAVLDDLTGSQPHLVSHIADPNGLQMASISSSKQAHVLNNNQSSRGDGTIMNALNAYRAHIAAAVHDSLENLPEGTPTGVDGVRPRHRNPGAAPNEYAYSAAAVAASRRNGYSGVPAPLSQPKPTSKMMSTKDTFEMSGPLSHLTPPDPTASVDERLDFIDVQLDGFGKDPVLTIYECLGASERRRGGQALIQFARRIHSREEFALKFFLSRTDYEAEAACYRSAHLGSFMPTVERYVDNDNGLFRDTSGNAMPPCIVMERGESLRDRMKIAHADRAGVAQVLVNVALRLADLHEAGWVHRDLKPGNVLWLPRKQRWTLIDFALATHEGVETPVIFTPSYAAPEIVKAATDNKALVRARSSMDSWALGVMAFELLSGEMVFDPTKMTIDDVYAQLLGKEQLPWEGDRMTSGNWKKLGIFRHHVLKLLERDPAKRMTMQQFAVACDSIFDSRSLTARHRAFVTTK